MSDHLVKHLEGQVRLKDFKLNSLLDITTAINTNSDVKQLTRLFEFIVKEQLGYDKFVLFNHQDSWNCLLRVGYKGKVNEIDIPHILGRFKEITVIESSHSPILNDFDVVIPVYHKGRALAYLLLEGLKKDNQSAEMNYLSFIQTLANIIVVAMRNL